MGGSACIVGSAAISALRAPMHTKLICEKEEKRGWVGSFRIESRGLAAVSKKKKSSPQRKRFCRASQEPRGAQQAAHGRLWRSTRTVSGGR